MRVTAYASSLGLDPARPPWVPQSAARRMDPLAALACRLVHRLALPPLHADTALVVGTAWGAVDSTLSFLADMAHHGDDGPAPAAFASSVHHTVAGTLGERLGIHGPTATVAQDGLTALAALRWAHDVVAAGRAPCALVVAVDRVETWTARQIAALAAPPAPPASGGAALFLSPTGPGRELHLDERAADWLVLGDALRGSDRRRQARARGQPHLIHAPQTLEGWWPGCGLAALPWTESGPIALRAVSDGQAMNAWFGPWCES